MKVGGSTRSSPSRSGLKSPSPFDAKYQVPANVNAVIVSPKLITSRAMQLTPAYTGGPTLANGAVIPQSRTAVPVELDDFRKQLEKLTESLQPTQPGGVSPLGAIINTAADNLRGQGAKIRDTIIKLSQAVSALGDHSNDIFATVKNLSTLVTALHDSADLMAQLNHQSRRGDVAVGQRSRRGRARGRRTSMSPCSDVTGFVADNREALGTTSDRLTSFSKALVDSLDDIKQTLHVLPTRCRTSSTSMTGPRLDHRGARVEQLRQSDHLPVRGDSGRLPAQQPASGQTLRAVFGADHQEPPVQLPADRGQSFVNAAARPNEVTYSEDWMRPDYRPRRPAELRRQPARRRRPVSRLRPPAARSAGRDKSRRGPAWHDGAPRRWSMMRTRCAAVAPAWYCAVLLAGLIRMWLAWR